MCPTLGDMFPHPKQNKEGSQKDLRIRKKYAKERKKDTAIIPTVFPTLPLC
jgi:hypothetical protein